MLLEFQNHYKKIVFDMLSLLPHMNRINNLKQTFNWYQDDQNRLLYLWKSNSNNWQGLTGVEVKPNLPNLLVIRQLILIPEISHREFDYFRMLDDVKWLYPDRTLIGNLETTRICQAWERSH